MAKKEAAAAKLRERQRVTPQETPGRQRVGPHIIENDEPDEVDQVQKRVEESNKNANRPRNIVRDTTFNKPVGRVNHRYPTRNIIQPVQVLGLGLPPQRPETNLGLDVGEDDMPPFLINAIIDDEEGEVDLGVLVQGIQALNEELQRSEVPH